VSRGRCRSRNAVLKFVPQLGEPHIPHSYRILTSADKLLWITGIKYKRTSRKQPNKRIPVDSREAVPYSCIDAISPHIETQPLVQDQAFADKSLDHNFHQLRSDIIDSKHFFTDKLSHHTYPLATLTAARVCQRHRPDQFAVSSWTVRRPGQPCSPPPPESSCCFLV
jgi:hypothetical protein